MEENASDPVCPNCHQSICAANFASHSAFCERNIKICKLCNEPIRIANEKEHLEESHVQISCDDCGLPLEKWMLIKHQEICRKRLVTCDYCEADVRFDEYSSHLDFCSSRTERCNVCKKYIMLKDKQKHAELHLPQKKLADDEVKQNIINEAISLQSVSEGFTINDKNENRNQYSLSSARAMANQSDAYTNSQSFIGAGALASSNLKENENRNQYSLSSARAMASQSDAYTNSQSFIGAGASASSNSKEVSKHYGQCPICKNTIPWIDMNVHIPNCADEAGKCSRCGEDVPNSEIKEHILKTCKKIGSKKATSRYEFDSDTNNASSLPQSIKEMRECPFCRQPCSNDRILEHVRNCPDNFFECSLCGENVAEKDRDIHGSMQCRVLLDSGPEYFYDYTASSNAANNKSKKSVTKRNKNPVIESGLKKCYVCHEEYSADVEEIHFKYCSGRYQKDDYSASSKVYENISKNSEKYSTEKKFYPVTEPVKINCSFCHEQYLADLEDLHLEYCSGIKEKDTAGAESYAAIAKLSLKNQPYSSYTKEQKEKISKFCSCIMCNGTVLKERMQNHLLVCKSNKKNPCAYCYKAIVVAEEENHLKFCKEFIASQNSMQVPANKNDYKGVIPKNSKFAQMVGIQKAKCSYCEVTLNADILKYHEEECIHKPELCDKCSKLVKIKDMDMHICGKGRKGKRGGKMNKEKSEIGTSFGTKIKNLFLGSPVKEIGESDEARNEPRYSSNSYMYQSSSYSDYNVYGNFDVNNEYSYSDQNEEPSIPCEFCGKLVSLSEIIVHSTGCDPESVKYRKPAAFEDEQENKSYSNRAENANFSHQKFFTVEKNDRNYSSTRLENRKLAELTTQPGEFLQNTYNGNISEFQPTKPDIVKESENISNRSKFQSVWNAVIYESDDEAVEVLPQDSPPKEITLNKIDEVKVSDITEKMVIDNCDEPDEEMSEMLTFIHDDSIDASGENSSDSAEVGYSQPGKPKSDFKKNEVPLVESKNYEKVYELLNKSKKANKSGEEHHLPYELKDRVRRKISFFWRKILCTIHVERTPSFQTHSSTNTCDPMCSSYVDSTQIFPTEKGRYSSSSKNFSADCSASQKYNDKKFEMSHSHLREINKDPSQNHHQTGGRNENNEDDVSKWRKWRSSSDP